MPWYVLYTNPRNEKKVAQRLSEKNIQVFCPVQETIKQWSDRKKKVIEPVFKSYIFVHLDNYETDQVEVLKTQGAVRFLWWMQKPGVVRDSEIEAIKSFLNKYKGATLVANIEEGAMVDITEGALIEQTGRVIKIKGNKAYLHIHSIGWNIMAELPLQSLKKQ
jgi:transcription antitermination factor NusG